MLTLRGSARQKKTLFFLSRFFKKCLKTAFLTCFFKNLAKTGTFYCFRRARKTNLVDLKKKVVKIIENPPPPPLEKILDPPLNRLELQKIIETILKGVSVVVSFGELNTFSHQLLGLRDNFKSSFCCCIVRRIEYFFSDQLLGLSLYFDVFLENMIISFNFEKKHPKLLSFVRKI